MALDVPRAEGVTGFVRVPAPAERARRHAAARRPLSHSVSGRSTSTTRRRQLIVRERAGAPAVEVPRSDWRFSDARPRRAEGRFRAGRDLRVSSIRSANPPIVGLGFPRGARCAALLRWGTAAERQPVRRDARARVPLRRLAERALPPPHALSSASTKDEQGRMVFDGGDAARRGRRAANSTCASASLRST